MRRLRHTLIASTILLTFSASWANDPIPMPTEPPRHQGQQPAPPNDPEGDLKMLGLQQKINQKGQKVTPLSNIMKERHDTEKDAISNIRN